jgi:hypothetical protein
VYNGAIRQADSKEADSVDPREREALTILCQELPALREESPSQPDREQRLLARIEKNAAARQPLLGLLAELLRTTPEDALDEQRGVATGLPGAGLGRADDEVFGCPDGACDRQARGVPAGAPPWCAAAGREMRRL